MAFLFCFVFQGWSYVEIEIIGRHFEEEICCPQKRHRWGWGKMFRSVEHFLIFALQCFRSINCCGTVLLRPQVCESMLGIWNLWLCFHPFNHYKISLSHAHKHMLILFLSFTCLLLIFLSFLSYPSLSLSDWYQLFFVCFAGQWPRSNLCKWVDKCGVGGGDGVCGDKMGG